MPERSEAGKRGYLHEDFRLFHLKDSLAQRMDYHYHEFDKLILLLHGKVTYVVEGVTYFLKPWDVLLVQHSLIHKPIIDPAEPYERVVVWLGREWMRTGDWSICGSSSAWRRPCALRTSALRGWQIPSASSC